MPSDLDKSKAERRQTKRRRSQEEQLTQRLADSAREYGVSPAVLRRRRIAALDAGWSVAAILSGRALSPDGKVRIRQNETDGREVVPGDLSERES